MRDTISTPAGTDTVLQRAAEDVGDVLRSATMYPPASVAEVVHVLRRLLVDSAVAASTGNQGDKHTLVLALTDVVANARVITQSASKTIDDLVANDPHLAEHLGAAIARRDQGHAP